MVATKIADIVKIMEMVAPERLAESWDNVGLQTGQPDWPVKKIWVALDPLPNIVASACEQNVDLLITHHPLIFYPLNSIDFSSPIGSIILKSARQRLAIFSAHTNFDSVSDGLNDILANRIGLKNIKTLEAPTNSNSYKLVFFVPLDYEQKVLEALFETHAGRYGAYSCCSFRNTGKGSFRPGPIAKPFIGQTNSVSHVDEIRIETIVDKQDLNDVIEKIRTVHPYETMAYDVYRLSTREGVQGLGRVGDIEHGTELKILAEMIKKTLSLPAIKIVGKPDLSVKKAALCTGSGSGLIKQFFSSGADVYISGDMGYHDARAVESANLGLIDIGHFASEHLMVEELTARLQKIIDENKIDVDVEACRLEKDPFLIL